MYSNKMTEITVCGGRMMARLRVTPMRMMTTLAACRWVMTRTLMWLQQLPGQLGLSVPSASAQVDSLQSWLSGVMCLCWSMPCAVQYIS